MVKSQVLKPRGKTSRIRAIGLRLALLCMSTVAALVIAELLVRQFAPQQLIILRSDIWKPAPSIGFRHRENVNTTINTGEKTVRFLTDEEGFRIGERSSTPTQPDLRVLALGDSFLEALQVENDRVMTEVLRRNLEQQMGVSVHIDNTGVGGWSPNRYLIECRRVLQTKTYDLGLVFIYMGNDVLTAEADSFPERPPTVRHRWRIPRTLRRRELVQSFLYPINDWLEVRSQLFILTKQAMRVPLAKAGLTAAYFPQHFLTVKEKSSDWETTAGVCEKIQAEFAAQETDALFVFLPTPYQVHADVLDDLVHGFAIDRSKIRIDLPNRMLAREFSRRGLHFVDVLEPLRAEGKTTRLFGAVDQHFNEHGHEMVAEAIQPAVAKMLAGGDPK